MRNNLTALADRQFDVLVIGGGAAGAAAAREASLRGLATALIEREDFGSGTSAQCFKVVHGGIRYLQHGDIGRLRASCSERSAYLRIAPHLVAPLPFAIPTYGRGRSGKWLLRAGMWAYDALTADCNRHVIDASRRIRRTRFLSRTEALQAFPDLDPHDLTGAAIFEDGQMYNPPRLVLAFIAAAVELGAQVANYVEAERLLRHGPRVTGVLARDCISGERLTIRARVVINAAGPWAEGLLHGLEPRPLAPGTYSRDACFVVAREPSAPIGLAVQGRTRDSDAMLARSARHLFLVPWRGRTLVGVWHSVVPREPDAVELPWSELRQFIAEINGAYPALALDVSDVRLCSFGLVPFGEASRQRPGALSFGKQSRIIDHSESGIPGLVSAISVRYTVARMDAVAAVNIACRQLERAVVPCGSRERPLPGGEIENFPRFAHELAVHAGGTIPADTCAALARNHGTNARRVLALAAGDPALGRCITGTSVLAAEIAYAVREEMARRLTDIVFRRTELGTDGNPGTQALDEAEDIMRRECGWSERRSAEERARSERQFARYLAPSRGTPRRAESA